MSVAAKLGISPSTVSRALRAETAHLVSAERRKQIINLIGQQNFAINPGARMLRHGINTTLAVVVQFDENIFSSEFYGRLLSGILQAATTRGWQVQIRLFKNQGQHDFRETIQTIGLDVSGIIYLADPLTKAEVEQIRSYRRPLVVIKSSLQHNVNVQNMPMHVIGVDNHGGARTAVNFLVQLGHSHIGLLLGPEISRDACERKEGYLAAMREAGLQMRDDWIVEGDFSIESGRLGMEQLLKSKQLPTAVCCANDEIAFGALNFLQTCGKQCPGDISLVGFDDGFWATTCRPALTTIRQPLADIAERAVCAIIYATRAQEPVPPPAALNLPTSLVIRGTTKAVPQK